MKFKETEYGDLTGQTYTGDIKLKHSSITDLDGMPTTVDGSVFLSSNKFKDLNGSPKLVQGNFSIQSNFNMMSFNGGPSVIKGVFNCYGNEQIKDQIEEVCKCQIMADTYITDYGDYKFSEIKERFMAYKHLDSITSKGFRTLLGLKK